MTSPPPPGWGPPQSGYDSGPWPQQPNWTPPPTPKKQNSLKWLLISVAVLLVIAISVGATLLFTQDDGDSATSTASSPSAMDIASASDKGPISIITEDPTCAAWRPIASTLSKQESQGWQDRDFTLPSTAWTPEQRSMHESIAEAMQSAANQTVPLVSKTPHRAMRELYEQSIAYWRLYADSIPQYTEADNSFAVAGTNASSAIVSICGSIEYGSAEARSILVDAGPTPTSTAAVGDVSTPSIFLTQSEDVCKDWNTESDKFDASIAEWQQIDGNVPASDWTPSQRDLMQTAAEKMERYSVLLTELGSRSDNPAFRDFAELASIYWLAYSKSVPTHSPTDNYLSATAAYVVYMVYHACEAVE